jgi:hypothetical protein
MHTQDCSVKFKKRINFSFDSRFRFIENRLKVKQWKLCLVLKFLSLPWPQKPPVRRYLSQIEEYDEP